MNNKHHKFFVIFFLTFFSLSLLSAQTVSVKEMRAQAGSLRKDIAAKEKILLSSQKDVKSRLNNLDIITAQIKDVKKLIALLQKEVKLVNDEIKLYNKEIKRQEKIVEQSRAEYAEALRRARKFSSSQSKLMFVFSADDFNTMVRRYRYAGEFMDAHKALADSLKLQIAALEVKRAKLEATRLLKAQSLREQEVERAKLQKLEKQQRNIIASLKRESKLVELELNKKRSELLRLNKAIDREIERVLAEERATKKKVTNSNETNKKAPEYKYDAGVEAMSGSFLNNKKKLPIPITGPYLVVEGYGVKNAISGKGNVPINTGGITFEGGKGAKARCIFDGKVTAVLDTGNYTFVLVRHGKYISVYCNLDNVRVRGGENIKAGDIIGDVAVDAKEGNPRMLFQLRQEKQKLNPMEWLKM